MKSYRLLSVGLPSLAAFLFWWLLYPQWMNYHEQYQMFLFSGSYLWERIALPGGAADWISEFLVQFFHIKWLGAMILSLLFIWSAEVAKGVTVPLLIIVFMGDQDVLLSYWTAMVICLSAAGWFRKAGWHLLWAAPLLWWMTGPLAFIPLLYALITNHRKQEITATALICLMIFILHLTVLSQYTMQDTMFGINYHRLPAVLPALQIIIPAVALVLLLVEPFLCCLSRRDVIRAVTSVLLTAAAWWCTSVTYDKDKYEQLAYDYLIREERWDDVLRRAERYQPHNEFSASAVNLCLFMTGRMDDRMNDFYQCGTRGLLVPRYRDMLTDMPTAEAYWRLGFINSAFRFMFDMQEATGNNRKSARCTCRMVEALIVNGAYEPADKYIRRLEKTLFYRKWAEEARTYLWNERKISGNKIYAYLRSARLQDDFLFSWQEMDKMLGQLWFHNNNNIMAARYYNAYKRLEGGETE